MLKSDSELQSLFPFRSSNRFVCARGSTKARYPPEYGWIFVCTPSGTVIPLRSYLTTKGDAQVFRSYERKTWRATLKSDSELQSLFPFCSSNQFVCARGSAKARKYFFGRFLLPRLKGPSSPYGVIRRRRGMRKFFVPMNEKPGDLNYSRLLI